MNTEADAPAAVQAEVLYLLNLLLFPGLAFIGLLWLAYRHRTSTNELVRCHLKQTLVASLWAGVLLTAVALGILALGGLFVPATWIVMILYVLCCHATLVLIGVFGLSRAMAGQTYVYPLIGSRKW
ncbi:hypothetical protein [Noviherbaspirillum sp.]|uniref:hypothetical protein n=1 Tax=Noviherbaspirillum sp. TaxID=1926288 RepID=UPI002D73C830|nr:hypothetical protein [Noviherbaspirillum sp.]HZW21121.1 hypothetical protein [Noviherbaspirillum sp.]